MQPLVHRLFPLNVRGKDFFIADIHGRYDELRMLLESINFKYQVDRLFATGDLIDRGPKSHQCLNLLKEPWFFSTLGNHENFLLEASRGSSYWKALWFRNGGVWSLELTEDEICDAANTILKYQPLTLTVETQNGNLGIVHAEYPFNTWPVTQNAELKEAEIKSIINGRETLKRSIEKITKDIRCIISGHSEVKVPVILGNQVFMNIQQGDEYSNLTICEIIGNELAFYSDNNEELKNISIP
jgi:serine/threonine protein phosphatase 1